MKLAALILLGSTGCFYFDPINQRPSIDIRPASDAPVHRSELVALDAVFDDPDGHTVSFTWNAYACSDTAGCDEQSVGQGSDQHFEFTAPVHTADTITPASSVRVTLDAQDDYGAKARPTQELVIPELDALPTVELRKVERDGYVVNTPIDLYARVGDPDDGPAKLMPLQWKIYRPNSQPMFDLVDDGQLAIPSDKDHLTYAQTLTPKGTGDWAFEVTATDPLGEVTTNSMMITVSDDQPPCLGQWDPATPPPGQTLPLTAATVFSVPIVNDDLDVYPPRPSDPVLGVTSFTWSLKRNAGARQVLTGATGNAVDVDPANFTPGDILEVRVEIDDRKLRRPLSCADTALECSIMNNDCLQRETWRVEVR